VAGTTLTDTPSAASFPSIPRITSGVATTIYDQWTSGTSNTTLYPLALAPAGGMPNSGVAAAHSNISPFLTMNFCIALQGEWPSRN
jgi:microcystin-dependent protein